MSQYETPMMKQYLKIKKEHNDCLLLFRLGDFYELFMDDAKVGADILDIALTSRDRGKDGRIPMAGVPYHALDSYLSKLVNSGHKVAICEQVSEPSAGNLVEREVVRIITPGTILDSKALDKKQNNYILSISLDEKLIGFAFADLSTGDFQVAQYKNESLNQLLNQEISRFNPREAILNSELYNDPVFLKKLISNKDLNIYPFHNWPLYSSDSNTARSALEEHFEVTTLHSFDLHNEPQSLMAAAALLGYLKHTQKGKLSHIKSIKGYKSTENLVLDSATIFNLELFSTIRDKNKEGSLLNAIDRTNTAMGGRLLKKWMIHPLYKKDLINERHEVVSHFVQDRFRRNELKEVLSHIHDIERLLSRLSVGVGNARDLNGLKNSLQKCFVIRKKIENEDLLLLKGLSQMISTSLEDLVNTISKYIVEDPPVDVKAGGIINEGIQKRLDDLRGVVLKNKNWIAKLQEEERKRSGINSLKVKFNKVFGFYIEISNSNLENVPDNYIRKQTLVNAERYITPELKEKEEIILKADEEINKLEYEIFTELVREVLKTSLHLQEVASAIASLDCLVGFAEISEKHNYCQPKIINSGKIEIKDGRHPVVERIVSDHQFVPNDLVMDHEANQLHIITGPNMAGKSVYIRQVALIVLMAQIGCFVPARSAKISLVDRIFVRSGASDVISEGLSTFMVEMIEAAYILNHATVNSLIVMDEIGRGTSTYDGISIASAIAEFLVTKFKDGGPKTLFATHYHELQNLAQKYSTIKNFQMAVKHENGEPVFLYKVIEGGASHSFGVSVAKMAGIPSDVISSAAKTLHKLESNKETPLPKKDLEPPEQSNNGELIIKELKKLDVDKMTPLEAMNNLNKLIKLIK